MTTVEEVVVQVSFAGNFASSLVIAGAVSSWVLMPGATNTHTCKHNSKHNTAYSRHHPQPLHWHYTEYTGPVLLYTSGSVLSRATEYDNSVQSMPDSVVLQPTHTHAQCQCTESCAGLSQCINLSLSEQQQPNNTSKQPQQPQHTADTTAYHYSHYAATAEYDRQRTEYVRQGDVAMALGACSGTS